MAKGRTARRLRIPAQFIDGAWECKFGGQIPVEPGTNAEIIVDRGSISDAEFLKTLEAKDFHKVLDEDAILLVGLTVRPENPLRDKLKQLLRSYGDLWRELGTTTPDLDSHDTHFVEIRLAGPNKRQAKLLGTSLGGLWLITEGVEATGLASTTIKLPEKITNDPVASVNHAYTRPSEIFETSRISHTGNIYKRVLYREENGKWYPLDVLRNRALQKVEHKTAQALWTKFMAKMTSARQSP
jgi:hypothetical protein